MKDILPITAIIEAMEELTNMPCGGIGKVGPTVQELDEQIESTGRTWANNSEYHCAQRTWRLLERALHK